MGLGNIEGGGRRFRSRPLNSGGSSSSSSSLHTDTSEQDLSGARKAAQSSFEKSFSTPDSDIRDVLDLLKLTYIIQRTGIATAQVQTVNRTADAIWNTLRISLTDSPLL
ncbi:uncharacterized protein LOC111716475, partial [Eurytemora carolleeae]|uniref:uncharacterized protein LOC111716475 n=1 Tax=Eurytemora carolleeae TaxID=1294199 RepID=UPI000C774EFE